MTDWCSCNKLREAEEKAAKWDALSSMTIGMRPIAPETNYERYFGTPAKAERTLRDWCKAMTDCSECPFFTLEPCPDQTTGMYDWLESEAE